jgi:hypothetical protein
VSKREVAAADARSVRQLQQIEMPRDPYPPVRSPALIAFAGVAEEYCRLMEGHTAMDGISFLRAVHGLLPRLYAAGLALPVTDILFDSEDADEDESEETVPEAPEPTRDPDRGAHEEWRALYLSLGALIGERNFYREVFDPYEPVTEAEVTGSLADDLADIYRDLRAGLRKWERGESGEALWEWRFHFEGHWSEHLTGALRALCVLSSTYELPWPDSAAGAA